MIPRKKKAPSCALAVDPFSAAVYDTIARIPRGRVVTYGQVALLAGKPRGHRAVARALRICPDDIVIPWFRVLGKASKTRARIAIPHPEGAARQRKLLRAEGVVVDENGCVSLLQFGFLPTEE